MHVLITGAAGMIGQRLAARIARAPSSRASRPRRSLMAPALAARAPADAAMACVFSELISDSSTGS